MKYIITALTGIAFASSLSAVASAQQTKPLAYLEMETDSGSVDIAVTDHGPQAAKHSRSSSRVLNIVCAMNCTGVDYVEPVDEYPLGLFRLSDLNDLLFSTWVGGSAYVVRAYKISAHGAVKVLDVHTIKSPEIFSGKNGHPEVKIYERASQRSTTVIPATLFWDGRRFIRAKPNS